MTTLDRRNIRLVEEQGFSTFMGPPTVFWRASLSGPLSTEEIVNMARTGPTAQDALTALETAINEQGWELRDS